jgi:AsmA family
MPFSRRTKILFCLIVLPLALIALLVVAAFVPAVQTAVARRVLAGQGEVARVAVGLSGAEVTGFSLNRPGLRVSSPSLAAAVPLLALTSGKVEVRSLVAHDLVIEIDPAALAAEAAKTPVAPATSPAPKPPFAGVLRAAKLPELSIEDVDISGVVRVAGASPIEATFALKADNFHPGQIGLLELKLKATTSGATLDSLITLRPTLGANGQLASLATALEAVATSAKLAQPARLRVQADVAAEGAGETYTVRVLGTEAALVELDARWAPGASDLPGRWKLALRDTDLAPFALGVTLPQFNFEGEGDLKLAGTEKIRLDGRFSLAADRLETVQAGTAKLPALGPIVLRAAFAVEAAPELVRVESFALRLIAKQPVLNIETRQPFTFAPKTGQITASTTERDLALVELLGVPTEWVRLFVPDLALAQPITGAFNFLPTPDGFTVTARTPLVLTGVAFGPSEKPLLALDAIRVEQIAVQQSATGLNATVGRLRLVSGPTDLLSAKLNVSVPKGGAPSASGELTAQLGALVLQPALRGKTQLSAGEAKVSFNATLADTVQATAKVQLSGLRAGSDPTVPVLPELALDAEVTRAPSGVLTAKLPLTVKNTAAARSSDLQIALTLTPGQPDIAIAATLASQLLYVPDLQAFAALAPAPAPAPSATPAPSEPAPAPAPATAPDAPLWAGVTGDVQLALARIVYAPGIEVLNTQGRIALTREALSLSRLQTVLGTGGALDLSGGLRWLAPTRSYDLSAQAAGRELAVGPLLKVLSPGQPVPLEGLYDFSGKIAGAGADPAAAAKSASAELRLAGRAGSIRAINLETNKYVKTGSALAGLAGLAGALTGNQQLSQRGNQLSALNAIAKAFSNLPYDELAVEAQRKADGTIELGNFSLLSPQMQLRGAGALGNLAGRTWLDQPLQLQLDLGARGDLARYFDALGLLAEQAAGSTEAYTPLTDPLVVDGTLRKVGTAQITRLLTRALGL